MGSPYEGPPGTPHSGIMDTPDAPHTPKYLDSGSIAAVAANKSAFVELQQHGLVFKYINQHFLLFTKKCVFFLFYFIKTVRRENSEKIIFLIFPKITGFPLTQNIVFISKRQLSVNIYLIHF